MSPDLTLQFSIPDAPRHFVSLEMPATSNKAESLLLLPDDLPGTRFIKVLHGEGRGLVDRRVNEDVAIAITNGDTRADRRESDAGAEDGLSTQVFSEVQSPGSAAVDAGQRSLQDRASDLSRVRFLVGGMLIQRYNSLSTVVSVRFVSKLFDATHPNHRIRTQVQQGASTETGIQDTMRGGNVFVSSESWFSST